MKKIVLLGAQHFDMLEAQHRIVIVTIDMPYKDKIKQREYQRQWMEDLRREFFYNKSCLHCWRSKAQSIPATKLFATTGDYPNQGIWSRKNFREIIDQHFALLCDECHKVAVAEVARDRMSGISGTPVKLTYEDVCHIKFHLQQGRLSLREIGRTFGIQHSTVAAIRDGKLWSRVP